MTKGTPSMGKRNKSVHVICRRCGSHSFHKRHRECSKCGFGKSKKLRELAWQTKRLTGERKK
jgi:large subunit ribosomal protein L37e